MVRKGGLEPHGIPRQILSSSRKKNRRLAPIGDAEALSSIEWQLARASAGVLLTSTTQSGLVLGTKLGTVFRVEIFRILTAPHLGFPFDRATGPSLRTRTEFFPFFRLPVARRGFPKMSNVQSPVFVNYQFPISNVKSVQL